MRCIMNLKEIIKDIFSDISTADKRLEDSSKDLYGGLGNYDRYGRRNQGGGGFLVLLVPHFIGFAVGLAIARLVELPFSGYIALGTLCAIIGGVYKSVSYDKLSLMPAIVRNILMISPVFLYFAVVFALE